MSFASNWRKIEAARKRVERESLKLQRELVRQANEREKLSLLEQAKLEVATFENAMEVLLSVHKDGSASFDWMEQLCALPPCAPPRIEAARLRAELNMILEPGASSANELARASVCDDSDYAAAVAQYEKELAEWARMQALARSVLDGETSAYGEAVNTLSQFGELSVLGSSISLTVRSAALVECVLRVNGREAIPAEVKSLSATGKVVTKAMPKARFQEVYQDYVCGCVLRVGRELLALLPIQTVIVTAMVASVDAKTGQDCETPVLSVAMPRSTLEGLDFARLDPSDSMANFTRRGDVSIARKGGDFDAVIPLTSADLADEAPGGKSLTDIRRRLREMQTELAPKLKPKSDNLIPELT
jgi:hypothetical protein